MIAQLKIKDFVLTFMEIAFHRPKGSKPRIFLFLKPL